MQVAVVIGVRVAYSKPRGLAKAFEIVEDVSVPTGSTAASSFYAQIEQGSDGWQRATLAGSIDENADLQGLFAKLTGDAVLNMQQVERVNSMGVHRWIPLATAFSQKHRLMIDEISYALVQNANVVANLFGAGMVRSCSAPYFCGRCKINCTVIVTCEEVIAAGFSAPERQCSRCNSVMEFDELDGYFGFFRPRTRR
jgi:hypothetical protein